MCSGSVYSVLAVALERYITICQPFNYNPVSVILPNFRYYEMGYYKIWFFGGFNQIGSIRVGSIL